jgi:hypothetical protein
MCYRFSYLSHKWFYGVFQFTDLVIWPEVFTNSNFDFTQVTHTFVAISSILDFSKLLITMFLGIIIFTYLIEFLIIAWTRPTVDLIVASLGLQATSECREAPWTTVCLSKLKFC